MSTAAYTSHSKTMKVLMVMHVLAWIAFVGFMIDTGAIAASYIVSCFNPETVKRMYKGLETSLIYSSGFAVYTTYVFFAFAQQAINAYIAFQVIKVLSRVNMKNPFTTSVARRLEFISYILFGAFVAGIIHNYYFGWLQKSVGIPLSEWSTDWLFATAGIVFIISQVFRRGVELQTESDLTV